MGCAKNGCCTSSIRKVHLNADIRVKNRASGGVKSRSAKFENIIPFTSHAFYTSMMMWEIQKMELISNYINVNRSNDLSNFPGGAAESLNRQGKVQMTVLRLRLRDLILDPTLVVYLL